MALTGRKTVPNVFIGGRSVGGGDETLELRTRGDLHALLKAAGALDDAKPVNHRRPNLKKDNIPIGRNATAARRT